MIRFNNDYNHGAHEEILKALCETNNESYGGYGLDEWCEKAEEAIKKYIDNKNVKVHFMVGGTQVNYTVISAALRPYESVLCADTGHIHVHETGAVEHTGHKIEALKSKDGKITAQQVDEAATAFEESVVPEHITEPKLVYISLPTEYGTIYTKKELYDMSAVCKKHGLYLFVDGARLGYAFGSDECDFTLNDIAECADAFYIGGTKCGALFGEAVVLVNDDLKKSFRSHIKQNGGMLAKGWLLGLQFYTLFKDGLYFDITGGASKLAIKIRDAFDAKGVKSFVRSGTNQQFVILKNSDIEKLNKKYIYEFEGKIDDEHSMVRFCTAWSTNEADVDELVKDINELL